MSAAPTGINCKTFVSISSEWKVVADIADESLQVSYDEAQADRRGAPVGESEPTVRRVELQMKVMKDPTNAVWQALNTAFMSRSSIEFLALSDAPIFANGTLDLANVSNGTPGVRFLGKLHTFNESRNLNEVVFNEVNAKPKILSNFTSGNITGGSLGNFTTPT